MSPAERQQLRCLLNRVCQLFVVGLAHKLMVLELMIGEEKSIWIIEPQLNRRCTNGDSRDGLDLLD